MKTVAEYLQHAKECDALAQRAKTTEERTMIAGMAETWRMLARQREQHLKTQSIIDGMPKRDRAAGKPN